MILNTLIAEASNGDISSLDKLNTNVTTENFTVDALNVFLGYLSPSTFNDSRGRTSPSTDQLLLKVVKGIGICARCCDRTAKLKQRTVDKVLEKYDDIIKCVFFLSKDTSQLPALSMLASLANLDAGMESLVFSSRKIGTLFLQAWESTATGRLLSRDDVTVLVLFFSKMLRYDEDSGLLDLVPYSSKKLEAFSSAALDIIGALGHFIRNDPSPVHEVYDLLSMLGKDLSLLSIKVPPLKRRLRLDGLGQFWAQTIIDTHHKANPVNLETCLIISLEMVNQANRMAKAIEVGFLTALIDGLIRIPRHSKYRKSYVQTVLAQTQAFSCFPRFLKAIHPAMAKAMASISERSLWNNKGLQKMWKIMPLISQHRQILYTSCINEAGSTPISTQCDNDSHDYDREDESGTIPHACSVCHAVVYCSEICQSQDWDARHKGECAAMRVSYLDRRCEGVKYSHTARTFHKDLAVQGFLLHRPQAEERRRLLYPNDQPQNFIAIYDMTGQPDSGKSFHFAPFEEYLASRIPGDCPLMDARCDHVIHSFRKSTTPNVVLVELRLSWSTYTHFALLLEMKTEGEGDCFIRRVVARVINSVEIV